MALMLYSTVNTESGNMFFEKVFFVINTFYYFSIACHSNPPSSNVLKDTKKTIPGSDIKIKTLHCDFKNISDPLDRYSNYGDVEDSNIEKNRIYFNILKPNIALLPCYKNDIMLTETSNNLTNYFEKFTTNSPTACQRFCQVAEDCYFFTYQFKTNYCWFFNDSLIYSERQFIREGYISGQKYCETLHPLSKGGFKIQVHSPFLHIERVNDSMISFDLPTPHTHAWENCKEICSENKNCTSFDYCFREENESFEFFDCIIKDNTLPKLVSKTPNRCVKSVKQNCTLTYEK